MEDWKDKFSLHIYKEALKILKMENSSNLPPKVFSNPIVSAIPIFMASSSSKILDFNEDEYPHLTPHTSTHGVPFLPYTKMKI